MFSFKSVYFVIFTLVLQYTQADISDKRLCIDENCSELIAVGKTLLRYNSLEKNILSFGPNEDVKIFSYAAGTKTDLIGVELRGIRGYVNKHHIRETNLLKRPTLVVDTELANDKPKVPLQGVANEINANPTQEPYEIVDGTKIPLDVAAFTTETPIADILKGQDKLGNTKPLDSVPELQNSNQPVENPVVGPEDKKVEEKPEAEEHTNKDDDDEDDDDGVDDEDGEESDENEKDEDGTKQEKVENTKNVLPKIEDAKTENPSNVSLSSDVKETANNISISNSSSTDATVDDSKENVVISKEAIQSNQNSESVKTVSNINETVETIEPANEPPELTQQGAKVGDDKKNIIPEETVQSNNHNNEFVKLVSNIKETAKEVESSPELTQKDAKIDDDKKDASPEEAIKSDQNNEVTVTELAKEATTENKADTQENLVQVSNISEATPKESSQILADPKAAYLPPPVEESSLNSSAENTTDTKGLAVELTDGANTESSKPPQTEVYPGIFAQPTTETPIAMDVHPPFDIDAATPNPLDTKDEEQKPEDLPPPTQASFEESTGAKLDAVPNNAHTQENLVQVSNISEATPRESSQILADPKVAYLPPPVVESSLTSSAENTTDTKGVAVELTDGANTENSKPPQTEVYPGIFAQPTTETPIAMEEQKPEDLPPPTHASFEAKLDAVPSVENIEQANIQNNDIGEVVDDVLLEVDDDQLEEAPSDMFSAVLSYFGLGGDNKENEEISEAKEVLPEEINEEKGDSKFENPSLSSVISSEHGNMDVCDKESRDCPGVQEESIYHQVSSKNFTFEDLQELFIETVSSDMFLYLVTTSFSVIIMVFLWVLLEKCRREGPLIARINKLEQQLLATKKENDSLHEKASLFVEEKSQLVVETVPNEVVDELNSKLAEMAQEKMALEEQIQALEKELDTSTEVGIELNKIISEMLNSTDGSEILKENIEQMQKRVLEQQATINSLNETLSLKETEIHELRLELEICNKKITDLQGEVDKMVEKILRIEEERDQQYSTLESEIAVYQSKCKEALTQEHVLKTEILALKQKQAEIQRVADTKVKEYNTLKETLSTLKTVKNDKDAIKSFLDVSEIKAQLEQIKSENLKYSEQLAQEREINLSYTTQIQTLSQEVTELREKYEKADKARVEINTKLDVLNNYFKEKEEQMQKEIAKYETLWAAKEGEATSTTERIRYMQEELQNYKAQNESLKQEIVNQEVELKSQISMLEKKVHENWVTNRQAERKLEEARQEAALLRNRLTLRERAIAEGNNHIRMQSPLHQNGELPISPPPIDPTQSPPPLFNPRDHITKSPPIPGMPPHPFLPPPLGATPFIPPPPLDGMMPPPLGDISGMHPPFIPGLPPGMFPGDHRPPPLGRMSSPPPVGGRYSPESTVYSEYDRYDRRSPSPPYDSEYGASPPPIMGYSPYDHRDRRDDRREYKRPQPRSNGRNSKGIHSSGSENDSLGKVNKKPQRKV